MQKTELKSVQWLGRNSKVLLSLFAVGSGMSLSAATSGGAVLPELNREDHRERGSGRHLRHLCSSACERALQAVGTALYCRAAPRRKFYLNPSIYAEAYYACARPS